MVFDCAVILHIFDTEQGFFQVFLLLRSIEVRKGLLSSLAPHTHSLICDITDFHALECLLFYYLEIIAVCLHGEACYQDRKEH